MYSKFKKKKIEKKIIEKKNEWKNIFIKLL